MEIHEYEYQGEKGILLKDRSTMTNVFLTDEEVNEIIGFLFENKKPINEELTCWIDFID